MARLRIRIELNRGGVGVPLHKLASVVEQAQKFFHMLAEDVHVDQSRGEWLGFDFDHESLNFTAEFVGPVTAEQVNAFHAAFDGTTSLRRATIAQFASITSAIGEDELIGFGLYLRDQAEEPAEWRCLSRRDALRISEEMQLLIGAGELDQDTRLPAIANSISVARIFSERQERNVEPAKWASHVREVEANLDRRISRVEKAIDEQSGLIGDLHVKSTATEDSVRRLLGAVEGFCAQTTRQLEAMSAPALPAEPLASTPEPVPVPAPVLMEPVLESFSETAPTLEEPVAEVAVEAAAAAPAEFTSAAPPAPENAVEPESVPIAAPEPRPSWRPSAGLAQIPKPNWQVAVGAALLVMGIVFLGTWAWQNFATDGPPAGVAAPVVTANDTRVQAAPSTPAIQVAPAQSGAAPAGSSLRLEASELTWVAIRSADGQTILARLFAPGEERSLDLPNRATLRVGNAGGLQVHVNGQLIGPLGGHGQVREVVFRDGSYKISATEQP